MRILPPKSPLHEKDPPSKVTARILLPKSPRDPPLVEDPSILSPLVKGEPLLLYLSVTEEAIGCMLAQEDDEGPVEKSKYYLNKRMVG